MGEHFGSFANQSQYRMRVMSRALPADTAIRTVQIATAVGTLLASTLVGWLECRHDGLIGLLGERYASHEIKPRLIGHRLQVKNCVLRRSTYILTLRESIAGIAMVGRIRPPGRTKLSPWPARAPGPGLTGEPDGESCRSPAVPDPRNASIPGHC